MTRAPVSPVLLTWARERAGLEPADLLHRFPRLDAWEAGAALPTLKQLDAFARAVHVPVGYLFLPAPPEEPLPIPDFRTVEGRAVRRASPNLLDTLYACQERQGWYREFALTTRQPPAGFVGSAGLDERPEAVAARIAGTLGFDLDARAACRSWEEALRLFVAQADRIGVLVMVSGVVLGNNRRPLDVEEFRGFALADPLAPLVFVNGADSKSAQMFTLGHELAHLWLRDLADRSGDGGDFYRTTLSRVSRRFARALVESTLEGQTLYRDTFRMLGVARTAAFDRIARDVGLTMTGGVA